MPEKTTTTRPGPYLIHSGNAAEDLKDNSVVLEIICPELSPNAMTGTVGAGITSGATKLKDRDGNLITSQVTTANHIVATWEGASNQRYPPMVRKGEPVEVYKVADQDKYYWRTTGKGRSFRTTDRLYFEIGAIDPNKPGTEKTDENTYSAYLDSDQKKVGFRTSKANGEAMALKMEADLAAGTFYISDDSDSPGNRIYMDMGTVSGVPTFQINLTSGIVFKFEKDNAFIKIPKKLEIDVGERIVFNSPLTVFNINKAGTFIVNAANVTINGAKDIVLAAAAIGLNGATKVGGVFVAASARIANAIKGSASGEYNGATVSRPQESPVSTPSNSPDTSMDGIPYKTS